MQTTATDEVVSLVPVGVGLEADGIHDSLIVHQLVPFVIGESVELVVFGIAHNLVRFDHLGLAWPEKWLLDFVQDILTHDVVIQLGFSLTVESESSDLTFYVSLIGLIAVVFGTSRYEFHDVILLVQFTRKVPEVVAQGWVELSLVCVVDNGVCVIVEDSFPQLLQGGIKSEPGPTGGETGHKDVEVG